VTSGIWDVVKRELSFVDPEIPLFSVRHPRAPCANPATTLHKSTMDWEQTMDMGYLKLLDMRQAVVYNEKTHGP
jgi:hypothetical protein